MGDGRCAVCIAPCGVLTTTGSPSFQGVPTPHPANWGAEDRCRHEQVVSSGPSFVNTRRWLGRRYQA